MASIKKNLGYSIILTLSNYLFPLITYPYVSRVLGVEQIGFCAYVDSIINVVSLFAMMGVSYVGLRAIAQSRDSREEMSAIFSNLFTINLILCVITLLIFNVSLLFFDNIDMYKEYIYWGEFKIVINIFLIEWLYRGLENFKYITMRSIAIKIFYVVLIFLLVKTKDDMFAYYMLSIFMIAGNFIFNWIHKRNYIDFSLKKLQLEKYLSKVFSMGIYTILTSVYATFNISMLGFLSNNTEVGYYNTSLKIFHILTSLLTAYSSVMLPRMSSLVLSRSKTEIQEMVDNIYKMVFVIVLPLVYFFLIFADESVFLMSGDEFMGSVSSLRVLMILLLPFSIDQILVLQLLMPYKKDKVILTNSVIASLAAIIAMLFLLPSRGAEGSAIVLLLSETIIMSSSMIFVYKKLDIHVPIKSLIYRLIYSIPYILIFILASNISNIPVSLTISILGGLSYFVVERVITKDCFYYQMQSLYLKIKNR